MSLRCLPAVCAKLHVDMVPLNQQMVRDRVCACLPPHCRSALSKSGEGALARVLQMSIFNQIMFISTRLCVLAKSYVRALLDTHARMHERIGVCVCVTVRVCVCDSVCVCVFVHACMHEWMYVCACVRAFMHES